MNMHVLRIEHKDSRLGPYFHPFESDVELAFMYSLHSEGKRWPSPDEDGMNAELIRFTDGWRFGWESLRSLRDWFDAGHIQNLHDLGFHATLWEVEQDHHHMRGEHQVAFVWHQAYHLGTVGLDHLSEVDQWAGF